MSWRSGGADALRERRALVGSDEGLDTVHVGALANPVPPPTPRRPPAAPASRKSDWRPASEPIVLDKAMRTS
jgi:hypothetical protein